MYNPRNSFSHWFLKIKTTDHHRFYLIFIYMILIINILIHNSVYYYIKLIILFILL